MTTTRNDLRRPTETDIEWAIIRSIAEILDDISDGILPWDVNHFSVLHDYVDANMYGGLCDEGTVDWFWDHGDGDTSKDARRVQDTVHAWLTARAHALGITEHVYNPGFARGPVRYNGQVVTTKTEGI